MKIWIDLANSPHAVFFKPLIAMLIASGHNVIVTVRDFAQTSQLAREYGINGTVIGCHGGASLLGKASNFVRRAWQLARSVRGFRPDIAVSHNSYSQILAARMIGIRVVTLMDYEGQPANHFAFRFSNKVIVPESFPDDALRRFGGLRRKVHKYGGFKEQVYLSAFEADPAFENTLREACGIPGDVNLSRKVLVTVRTPATMALYHRFQNPLFERILARLDGDPSVVAIVLPRTREQEAEVHSRYPHLRLLSRPLDGSNLVNLSDVVISAGGTMNREAAILGTPAYSAFCGAVPAVDLKLIEMGRMVHIEDETGIRRIALEKKRPGRMLSNPRVPKEITDAILGEEQALGRIA